MIRKQVLVLALLGLAGTAAMAESPTIDNSVFMSTLTRAEVRAEVIAAREAGTLGVSEIDLSPTMAAMLNSGLSREAVRAFATQMARAQFLKAYPA
jgi:hypothetical protein